MKKNVLHFLGQAPGSLFSISATKEGRLLEEGACSREVLIKKLETFTESTLVVAQNSLKSRETE